MMTMAEGDLVIKLPASRLFELSISRFRLEQHISEIKLLLYHLPTRTHSFVWPTNLTEIQTRIKFDLDDWLQGVQQIVASNDMDEEDMTSFQFQKLKHEQLYHSAVCLLFQPSQSFPSPSQEALRICYESCSKRLEIYDAVSNQEMLYYNWRNIHGIFSSGATIVYCAWASRDLQRNIPFAKLLRDLRTCSNHLSIGSQWWPSVRSGKESFEMMIDLIIKYFSDLQVQIQDTRTSSERQRQPTSSQAGTLKPPTSYSSVYAVEKEPAGRGIAHGDEGHPGPDHFDFVNQDPSFGISKFESLVKPATDSIPRFC